MDQEEQGPWFTTVDLGDVSAAKNVCFMRKQERNKTQILTKAAAVAIYRDLSIIPSERAPIVSKVIHDTTEQKTIP